MSSSKLTDWIQITASIGVFVGLLMVAFEIRESNRVATSQGAGSISDSFIEFTTTQYDTDVNELFVISIVSPDELTDAEIVDLHSLYLALMMIYEKWLNAHELGTARYDGFEVMVYDIDYYFAGKFGRAWFEANRKWMHPDHERLIAERLESLPIRTTPKIVEDIRSGL